jgi:hypothetical protein
VDGRLFAAGEGNQEIRVEVVRFHFAEPCRLEDSLVERISAFHAAAFALERPLR